MKQEISLEEFRKKAAELIREGKPLTGADGVFTPLIKQVLEASLEGELDTHLAKKKSIKKNRP